MGRWGIWKDFLISGRNLTRSGFDHSNFFKAENSIFLNIEIVRPWMEGDEPLVGRIKIWWDGSLVKCNFRLVEGGLPSHPHSTENSGGLRVEPFPKSFRMG